MTEVAEQVLRNDVRDTVFAYLGGNHPSVDVIDLIVEEVKESITFKSLGIFTVTEIDAAMKKVIASILSDYVNESF